MRRYCGRDFSAQELQNIAALIENNPLKNRTTLSRDVCRMFSWYKADGGLKEMSCRVAMLRMHRDGIIALPAPLTTNKCRRSKPPETSATNPQSSIQAPVHELGALQLQLVTRKNSLLWNGYIERYHYLGFTKLPGAQLRYFVMMNDQVLALLGFGAAAWQVAPRDKFIGWDHKQRVRGLPLIVNNARFLILPWVQSKNLASKILSMVSRQLPVDWHNRYNIKPVLLETFVDSERFTGACYRAANWNNVGKTKGRGKLEKTKRQVTPIKEIFLYPLVKNFRRVLMS